MCLTSHTESSQCGCGSLDIQTYGSIAGGPYDAIKGCLIRAEKVKAYVGGGESKINKFQVIYGGQSGGFPLAYIQQFNLLMFHEHIISFSNIALIRQVVSLILRAHNP